MPVHPDIAQTLPLAAAESRGVALLTGATGYIGSRLAPELLARGWKVRCLVRSAEKLDARAWSTDPNIEIIEADADDEAAVTRAAAGCAIAYYLIHSMMAAGAEYRRRDRALAEIFARAAAAARLPLIVYLGGLGETGSNLSHHLGSRREVEAALRSTGVRVTVLRAAMIIGSGSASFEILRHLVERLPIMITPRWVSTECQPIAVRNVIHDLVYCPETPESWGKTLDIGGPDVLSYREIMRIMAEELGLPRRLVIPVPVLTPRLSSLWIHLVTPISAKIARPLAEGLRNRVVCADSRSTEIFPQQLLTVREAIARALGKVRAQDVPSSWSGAGPVPGDPDWSGGTVFTDRRSIDVHAPVDTLYKTFAGIGGERGYFSADWLWILRGVMDRLIGGPGLRRGRRHPDEIAYGEAIDFWRVTHVEPSRIIELRAEMRLPGVATLTFEAEPAGDTHSRFTQTARFKPRGLTGLLYWWLVSPLHAVVFNGMLRGVALHAERRAASPTA